MRHFMLFGSALKGENAIRFFRFLFVGWVCCVFCESWAGFSSGERIFVLSPCPVVVSWCAVLPQFLFYRVALFARWLSKTYLFLRVVFHKQFSGANL